MIYGRSLQGSTSRSSSHTPTIDNNHRMNLLIDQLLGLANQLSGKDDNTRRSVTYFLVLNFGELHENLGSRVIHVHRLENRSSVIRHKQRTVRRRDLQSKLQNKRYILNNLIHSLGAQSGLHKIGHCRCSDERGHTGISTLAM